MEQGKALPVRVMVGGLGGHGVLMLGRLLAEAGMSVYKHVLFFPNYGARMRWGDSECTVILSDEVIKSVVSFHPQMAIIMSTPMFNQMENRLKPGGTMVVNSSVVSQKPQRDDLIMWYLPASEIAAAVGSERVANLVLLGAFFEATKLLPVDYAEKALDRRMAGTRAEALLPLNRTALYEGAKKIAKMAK